MLLSLNSAAVIAGIVHNVFAVPADTTTSVAGTAVPTLTLSTSVASPSASISATLPAQAPLPPVQGWCIGQIYCPGSVRLSLQYIRDLSINLYLSVIANSQHCSAMV